MIASVALQQKALKMYDVNVKRSAERRGNSFMKHFIYYK